MIESSIRRRLISSEFYILVISEIEELPELDMIQYVKRIDPQTSRISESRRLGGLSVGEEWDDRHARIREPYAKHQLATLVRYEDAMDPSRTDQRQAPNKVPSR